MELALQRAKIDLQRLVWEDGDAEAYCVDIGRTADGVAIIDACPKLPGPARRPTAGDYRHSVLSARPLANAPLVMR
jgi:hypothetical protein